MAQGRGTSAIVILFCMLVASSEMAHAKTFVVGDAGGWTFKISKWPSGKTFNAGDTLEFNYDPSAHNVVKVDEAGYNSCTASKGSEKFQSGNDHINLVKGTNYFICTFPGHCLGDVKIAVNAA
ncbi:basic blue protein [Cajanus cajan]|uniref:Basic blue protein n=1 Tax=Cajanus cajan TaxID=3821 RepID=A0A151T7V9_CAJCA|nr:basic blue protein [Cajanus cajan]KYP63139.1 Chemocyanin [Cajanus cajan]